MYQKIRQESKNRLYSFDVRVCSTTDGNSEYTYLHVQIMDKEEDFHDYRWESVEILLPPEARHFDDKGILADYLEELEWLDSEDADLIRYGDVYFEDLMADTLSWFNEQHYVRSDQEWDDASEDEKKWLMEIPF